MSTADADAVALTATPPSVRRLTALYNHLGGRIGFQDIAAVIAAFQEGRA